MSKPLNPSEARGVVGPHEPGLRETFYAALDRYLRQDAADRAAYTLHAQASVFNSLLLSEARRVFASVPGVKFLENKRLHLLDIDDLVLLRFKKLDESLQTSNVPTHQSLGYSQQEELDGLPPAATKLNAGYRLNEFATQYAMLCITCPASGGILYMWLIAGPEQGELNPPLTPETPFLPQTPVPPAVKVKEGKNAQEDDARAGTKT